MLASVIGEKVPENCSLLLYFVICTLSAKPIESMVGLLGFVSILSAQGSPALFMQGPQKHHSLDETDVVSTEFSSSLSGWGRGCGSLFTTGHKLQGVILAIQCQILQIWHRVLFPL